MNPGYNIYVYTSRPVAELFYDIILAVIFNFDIINIKDGSTKWRLVFKTSKSRYRDIWIYGNYNYYQCAGIIKGKYKVKSKF